MIAGGMEIPAVQKVLGHSQSSTTSNIYAHVVEGRAETAVGAIADRVKALRSA
jgi:site-specific recombinase XerD